MQLVLISQQTNYVMDNTSITLSFNDMIVFRKRSQENQKFDFQQQI